MLQHLVLDLHHFLVEEVRVERRPSRRFEALGAPNVRDLVDGLIDRGGVVRVVGVQRLLLDPDHVLQGLVVMAVSG